ncbi:MAG: hypothetical protein ACRCV9_04135 [Burkholderiaceae bacterium]
MVVVAALLLAGAAFAEPPSTCSVVMTDCAQGTKPYVRPATPKQNLDQRLQSGRERLAGNAQSGSVSAQSIGAIVVEGQSEPVPGNVVKGAFERHLGAAPRVGTETWVRDDGAICSVNHDCRGLFCTVMCTAGKGTLGNRKIPDGNSGINIIQR